MRKVLLASCSVRLVKKPNFPQLLTFPPGKIFRTHDDRTSGLFPPAGVVGSEVGLKGFRRRGRSYSPIVRTLPYPARFPSYGLLGAQKPFSNSGYPRCKSESFRESSRNPSLAASGNGPFRSGNPVCGSGLAQWEYASLASLVRGESKDSCLLATVFGVGAHFFGLASVFYMGCTNEGGIRWERFLEGVWRFPYGPGGTGAG